jgi:hypothetical protein
MGYGDLNPVFRLCWNMRQDAGIILARAIPERRAVLNAYVLFLMQEGRLAASEPVAAKLAALATSDDQWTLIAWCNRQLDAGAVPAALEVWNTLCARHLLPYAPLDRDRAPLTDGDFRRRPWRRLRVAAGPWPGVTMGRNRSPRYLWVAFQRRSTGNVRAAVAIRTRDTGRELQFAFRVPHIGTAVRQRFALERIRRADGHRSGGRLALAFQPGLEARGTAFHGAGRGLVRLTLTCQRLPGATRIEVRWSLRICRWSASHDPRDLAAGWLAALLSYAILTIWIGQRWAWSLAQFAVFAPVAVWAAGQLRRPSPGAREPVAGAAVRRAGLGPAAARHPPHGLSLGDVECRIELGHLAGAVLPGVADIPTTRGAALVSAVRAVFRIRAERALDGPDVHVGRQNLLALSQRLYGLRAGTVRLPESVCRVPGNDPADRVVGGFARPPPGIRELRDGRGHARVGGGGGFARRVRSDVRGSGRGAVAAWRRGMAPAGTVARGFATFGAIAVLISPPSPVGRCCGSVSGSRIRLADGASSWSPRWPCCTTGRPWVSDWGTGRALIRNMRCSTTALT